MLSKVLQPKVKNLNAYFFLDNVRKRLNEFTWLSLLLLNVNILRFFLFRINLKLRIFVKSSFQS